MNTMHLFSIKNLMKHIELVFARERQPKPPTWFGKEIVKYNVNDNE